MLFAYIYYEIISILIVVYYHGPMNNHRSLIPLSLVLQAMYYFSYNKDKNLSDILIHCGRTQLAHACTMHYCTVNDLLSCISNKVISNKGVLTPVVFVFWKILFLNFFVIVSIPLRRTAFASHFHLKTDTLMHMYM